MLNYNLLRKSHKKKFHSKEFFINYYKKSNFEFRTTPFCLRQEFETKINFKTTFGVTNIPKVKILHLLPVRVFTKICIPPLNLSTK